MNALKSFLFLILAAGLGAGYIPLTLLPRDPQVETGPFAYLAFPLDDSMVLLEFHVPGPRHACSD